MNKSVIIGITGGSGSGKTFFMESLATRFKPGEICFISQDNYYKSLDQQPKDDKGIENFDLPEAIDHQAFHDDLRLLKAGKTVKRKEYTFNNASAAPKILISEPAPIIVVEGLFIQYFKEIEGELDLKLFIEATDYVKLSRRIRRDGQERGYDVNDVLYRYENHVMPIYDSLIRPLQHRADLVVPNNSDFDRALDVIVCFLQARIQGVAY